MKSVTSPCDPGLRPYQEQATRKEPHLASSHGRDDSGEEGDNDMSNEIEHFFERQDEAVSAVFLENKGDELTDILVAALEEAFEILLEAAPAETVH
ncbi:hypothetical protein G9X64_24795 [Rhizobium sophorae]|uniref:Uncharacterized protein n=3 Tax=Rhizobium/Agrobacterium group TaxID=227290 RepID=A0ABR6A5G4_9HYPH|nr:MULTISPECIES: hypothetical protein [Rhizobium]MBA5801768.1 hypothetical protein [Rhizobium changzhiense]MBX4859542.1 hypothetical protein [Rhizobium bangladeshense]MCV9941750.1 hypothetical protein [Rhizobium sp. BT-175]NNU39634.1 hypothetical protein [Rhizobium sophorae]